MDWLNDVAGNPIFDRGLAIVLVFVLLKFLREDIRMLTESIGKLSSEFSALTTELKSSTAHQTNRMSEIREALREMIRMWASELKREGRGHA